MFFVSTLSGHGSLTVIFSGDFSTAAVEAGRKPSLTNSHLASPVKDFELEPKRMNLRGDVEDRQFGARFAKWRAVFTIGKDRPSRSCMESNANDLARYAALCQEANLVPIVEPEVLMQGAHSLEQCSAVTEDLLHCVFDEIYAQGILLEGMILKPNMILPGLDCPTKSGINEVADTTITCLLQIVPAAVSGIAFLSGGQPPEVATAHLNAMNTRFMARLPWPVTFSFARAIQQPSLQRWAGLEVNTAAAQQVLYHRAKCNQAAIRGEYYPSIESP